MTEIESSSFALPYTPDIDMQPRPMAVTSIEVLPSLRFSIPVPLPESEEIEVFALLPVAHLEIEARDLGFLDAAVVVDELPPEARVQCVVGLEVREGLGQRARQRLGARLVGCVGRGRQRQIARHAVEAG